MTAALILIATGLAALAAAPAIVTFPGPQTSVRSPAGVARVFYVDLGADEDGQNLSLRFDPGRGPPVLLKRFDRSVDIGWSPSGRRFFVNDYLGSNIADCLIVRPEGAGVRGLSLLRAVARSPGRPPETPANAHFYVHCNGWASDTTIEGVVAGHTDETNSHGFEHRFRYDAARGRLSWRGSRARAPNADPSSTSRK